MRLSAYITILFAVMLFVYNSFGDNSVNGWNVFYWTVLSVYIAVLNFELITLSLKKEHKFILFIGFFYWVFFSLSEVVSLVAGNYTEVIAHVNLWLSRSTIFFVGLIIFVFKFTRYDKQH